MGITAADFCRAWQIIKNHEQPRIVQWLASRESIIKNGLTMDDIKKLDWSNCCPIFPGGEIPESRPQETDV